MENSLKASKGYNRIIGLNLGYTWNKNTKKLKRLIIIGIKLRMGQLQGMET
jgi:hypothetical protein